jgi:hypothetical protein
MYLGLDLGTSGLKALLIDELQRAIDSVTALLAVTRPHPGCFKTDDLKRNRRKKSVYSPGLRGICTGSATTRGEQAAQESESH